MNIKIHEFCQNELQKIAHISNSTTKFLLKSPNCFKYKIDDDLAIIFNLGEKIKDQFYLLSVSKIDNRNLFTIQEVWKLPKKLVEDSNLDPYLSWQKFIYEFGLPININNHKGYFIHKEIVDLNNIENEILSIRNNENYSFVSFFGKAEEKLLTVCLLHSVDLRKYKDWIENEIKENSIKVPNYHSRLKKIPKGLKGWKKYEDFCTELIRFLFADQFELYEAEEQSRSSNNIDRRDLVISNRPISQSSIWADAKSIYKVSQILIEFKNLKDPITKEEIIQTSNYLGNAFGNLALIFSREKNSNLQKYVTHQYKEKRQILLVLSDEDIVEMLRIKEENGDPSSLLWKMKDAIERS